MAKNKYLLSIKDLNLSERLEDLIDAGITSFKIEGRLKDADYVANITAFYRQKIDEILKVRNIQKSSSGIVKLNFKPDPDKTFNRGYSQYCIDNKPNNIGSIDTPKSMGEFIGTVLDIGSNYFTIKSVKQINNADGLCFFDKNGKLGGTVINRAQNDRIYPQKLDGIYKSQKIYRNYNYNFTKQLKNPAERKVDIQLIVSETAEGIELTAIDQDKNIAKYNIDIEKIPAVKQEQAHQTLSENLKKLGGTIFQCSCVQIKTKQAYFIPISKINNCRRMVVDNLLKVRLENRAKLTHKIIPNNTPYQTKHLDYSANILNQKAKDFYIRHQVEKIELAAESGVEMKNNTLMTTKYCILNQLGLCEKKNEINLPLFLIDEKNNRLQLDFDCKSCLTKIKAVD